MVKSFIWKGNDVHVRLPAYKRLIASLLHAYRNAVDHGIELPGDREDAGKDPEGQIEVGLEIKEKDKARNLLIRIKDDGKGIDPEIIRQKIVEKGLVKENEARALDNYSVIQYIFAAGFSTAEQVSEISGRGIGMDIIAFEVKSLGGQAWVESEKGVGTQLCISVPYVA